MRVTEGEVDMMTRGSVEEYVTAVQERYRRASRREKARLLDEFTQVTGYGHKAAGPARP